MTFRQPHTHQRLTAQPMSPTRMLLMMEGAKPTAYAPAAASPYATAPSLSSAALHGGSINSYLPALLAPSPVPKDVPVSSPYLSKPSAVPPPAGSGGPKKRRGKNRHGGMKRTQAMTPGPDASSSSNSPSYLSAQTASRRNAATPATVLHTPPMTAHSPYGSQMPQQPLYPRRFTPNNLSAMPTSGNSKRLSPTAADLRHSLVTAHAVVVAEREPLPAPVFSSGSNRGGYNSGAKPKPDPHNLHSPPLSPIHGTLLGDAGLAPTRSPSSAAVITTTTTTSTTTTTVSPPSPSSSAASVAVLSNTTPDLLFLLTPTEHQALMMLLRARIDGKPGGNLTIDKPSSANSSIAIAGLPPQSPTSGSLRRPSLIANPTIPAHVAAELNLLSGVSNTPPSPSRSLHFAAIPAANDNLAGNAGTLTILSTAGQPAQPVSAGPGSPPRDASSVPPPGAGHRGRSKSFSSRASLPRRPSLQSVREEGGAVSFGGALLHPGNSLVPPVQPDHAPVAPVPNEEEERREYMLRAIAGANAELAGNGHPAPSEFGASGTGPTGSPLRGAIVRRSSLVAPAAGDGSDRPRASSLVVRPIGGGGLIALPPNWSRQGSHASSTHGDDDDESDTESVQMEPPLPPPVRLVHSATTTTTTVSHGDSATVLDQQASRVVATAPRAGPAAASPTLSFGPGVGNVLTIEPAFAASMERRHSVSGHNQLALPPPNRRQNAGRFTMGAGNFAAALKQHNVIGSGATSSSATGSISGSFPVELLHEPGLPFDQDRERFWQNEERAGQYWSLSHASLLLERIALEKTLSPQLESYLTQALDSISTAQAIVTQRMGNKAAIEEKLRTHPEPVADWLAEFAGGAAVPDEALNGSHAHSSRTSSISVSTARTGLTSGSLASPPTSPTAHPAKKASIAGMPGSPATAASSAIKPITGSTAVITAASPSSAAAEAAAAAARANDPSSSLVVLESYLLRDPILALLSKSTDWNFELFEFHEASSQHSLVLLSVALLRSTGIIEHFPSLDLAKFFAFFAAIEKGYKSPEQVPYHNSVHGADVMQGMVFFMQTPLLQSVLSPLDVLAGLVAAACHDYEHQGRNNAFMVATANPLAILYNDVSVMECAEEGTEIRTCDPSRPTVRVEQLSNADVSAGLCLQGASTPVSLVSVRPNVVSPIKFVISDSEGRTYAVTPNHRVTLVWGLQPEFAHFRIGDGPGPYPRWQVEVWVKTATPYHAVGERAVLSLRYWPDDSPLPDVAHGHNEVTSRAEALQRVTQAKDLLTATRAVHRGDKQSAREALEAIADEVSLWRGDVLELDAEQLWARMETEFRAGAVPGRCGADCVYAAVCVDAVDAIPAGQVDMDKQYLANAAGVRSAPIRSVVRHVRAAAEHAEEAAAHSCSRGASASQAGEYDELLAAAIESRRKDWHKRDAKRPEVSDNGEMPFRFVSVEVGGDHRFVLANGTVTHNSHHASASWQVLMRPECDFLSEFTVESRAEFRASFISAILHTDMTHHMSGVQDFEAAVKAKRSHGTWFSPLSKADRKMLLDMACHVSDLGNPAKPFHLAREWTARVVEEFYRQGDAEAALGLKISPMCDRAKGAVDAQQLGFIDFVVGPLFNSWADALEPQSIAPCLEHLTANKAFYKSRVPPPPTPVVAATPASSSGGSSTAASGTSSPRAVGSLSLAPAAAPVALQLIGASSLRSSPWKNGGGSTRELVCWPPGSSLSAGDFTWRASSATVSASGPFSQFPNRQRLLMILSGPGIKLHISGEASPRILTPADAAPILFDGSLAAHADLLQPGVSVEDVGVIFGPAVRVVATVKQLAQAQSHTLTLRAQPRDQQILVVLLRGSVTVAGHAAASSSSSAAAASVSLSAPLDSAFLADVSVDGSMDVVSAAHNSAILVCHISPA